MTGRLLCLLTVLGVFSGCKSPERDSCHVEGKATFRGEPLAGFHVALYSEVGGGGSALISEDGTFKFAGPMQEGEYVAYFKIPFETKGEARAKAEAMKLPEKYSKGETSEVKVKLVPGQNVLNLEVNP